MEEYHPEENEIIEIRAGHYIKKQNGSIIGKASQGDHRAYELRENLPNVDIAVIEVALALTAISGFVFTSSGNSTIKLGAGISFLSSISAAYALYAIYMYVRIPRAISDFYNTQYKKRNLVMLLWILTIWPIKTLWRSVFDPSLNHDSRWDLSAGYLAELGYVMLFWGLVFAPVAVLFFLFSQK